MTTAEKRAARYVESLRGNLMKKQRAYLEGAQAAYELGPKGMADMLGVNFNTYKAWLYGVNPMPAIATVAIDCLLSRRAA